MPLAAADDETGSEHEEKIPLTDPRTDGTAAGVAKVERSDGGEQEFETRATGLAPGATYRIEVDGFPAGMVIADAVGQAELELEWPDSSNPLPPELQPIEDLRFVEWLDDVDAVVLTGLFSGFSTDDDDDEDGEDGEDDDEGEDDDGGGDGDEFEGGITELLDDGFMLQTLSMLLRV